MTGSYHHDNSLPSCASERRTEIIRVPGGHPFSSLLRRLIDIVASSMGLLLLLPFLIPVVLAIIIDSRGPILFSQVRLGQHGRHFRLYKFRKFHDGARGRSVTMKNDSRMTRVGRFLERTKLDEVPQLWNVLRGDMSVVGPRPETLDFADLFQGPYRAVLDSKPGLFGPNQVLFRYEASLFPENADPHEFYRNVLFPAKARIDMEYFARRTLLSDGLWLVRSLMATLGLQIGGVAPLRQIAAAPPHGGSPQEP